MIAEKGSFVGHSLHSSTVEPMPAKRILAFSALLFLLIFHLASAVAALSYVELADAPTVVVDWSGGIRNQSRLAATAR